MELDVILHGANIVGLAGGTWAMLKFVVPIGISIRDALHDTAHNLKVLTDKANDHEDRLRDLEHWNGPERRTRSRMRNGGTT